MLERAAGCLENAGRRFFRDSSGAVRRTRSLYPPFSQYKGPSADFPHWLLAVVQSSDPRVSPNAGRAANDKRPPFLDFLYPPQTRTFAASWLSHSPRRLVSRRRRKTVSGLPRTYTSKAADPQPTPPVDYGVTEAVPGAGDELDGIKEGIRAKKRFLALFDQKGPADYELAWTHYAVAGYPLELNSALLAYLSPSERGGDQKRIKHIFDKIPVGSRSANDYLHLVKSLVAGGNPSDMDRVCYEAVLRGMGDPCLAFATATFVNNAQWDLAQHMWDLRPKPSGDEATPEREWRHSVISQVDLVSFIKNATGLSNFIQHKRALSPESDLDPAREFASFLIDHAFSSLKAVEDTSTNNILVILRKFNGLRILTAAHFIKLIETARSSEFRATFIRSVVIYRNFRWHMQKEVPPAKLIGAMIRSLTSFEITNGILYFMEEFTRFHGKLTVDAYKSALIAFSRVGDVSKVHDLFEQLVSVHGKPRSRRLLSPLLYVHARVGNVPETRRHFERIPQEFGLELNTVCWNILLTAHANAGDLTGSFETFEKMLKSGVELNSHTFGILMGICANRGDVANVRRLLALAKEREMQITAPLLDTIVEAYCHNGRFDIAESVAETCLGLDVRGSRVRMWNLLLWHYAFRIDSESISRVRSRMEAAKLHPDGMTYAALMLSLVLIGKTHSARRVFRALHRNRRVHATEFHYTIILYGYVRERNRDMVHIVFREIKDRFRRPGSSSSLLFLKSQLQRDLQLIGSGGQPLESVNMRLENAEKFLAETIADFDTTKLATKEPMPAAGRQSAIEAFPGMFYEYIMNAYGTRGASEKVRQLFDQFISRQEPLGDSDNVHAIAPLRLLNTLMHTHLRAEQYAEVEECWRMTFPRAIKLATPLNINEWLSSHLPSADGLDPPRPSLPGSEQDRQDLLITSGASDTLEVSEDPLILPSCRFLLSRPLSLYMRSLAYRNEIGRIPQVVAAVENAGFCLTTFNWSTYVQMLASSDKPSDQIEAFTVFEEKFMPNFPGWQRIRRGLGVKPPDVPATISAIEDHRHGKRRDFLGKEGRRYWSKIQPDFMQPTYISMVYLASALLGFRERSIVQGNSEVMGVYSAAPKTVEALGHMPYLREKFQGVLLRSRQQQGDMTQGLEGYEPYVWTGGVLGVGGRPRVPVDPETASDDISTEADSDPTGDQLVSDTKSQAGRPTTTIEDSPPQKTLNPEDEHDIETETNLEATRGQPDPDDEARHVQELANLNRPQPPNPGDEPADAPQHDDANDREATRKEDSGE